jgi:hypothetical protein
VNARARLVTAAVLLAAALVAGCGKPNRANIVLRKQLQAREGEIAHFKRQHDADVATISGLSRRVGTVPTLEPARLDRLFTVHGIRLERLTGGADFDPSKPGHEGLKVYVSLVDQTGDEFKSSGSFVIEAFDLSGPQPVRLSHCEFPVEQSRDKWHSFLMRYEYVLDCPWQQPPRHPDVTVKVQFTDELTGRQFDAQTVVKVQVPPTTQPTTTAAAPPVRASASPR